MGTEGQKSQASFLLFQCFAPHRGTKHPSPWHHNPNPGLVWRRGARADEKLERKPVLQQWFLPQRCRPGSLLQALCILTWCLGLQYQSGLAQPSPHCHLTVARRAKACTRSQCSEQDPAPRDRSCCCGVSVGGLSPTLFPSRASHLH